MSTFGNFVLQQEYASIAARGDPLCEIKDPIDWDVFRPRFSTPYENLPTTEAERIVADRIMTPADLRVLLEIVRRQMWE